MIPGGVSNPLTATIKFHRQKVGKEQGTKTQLYGEGKHLAGATEKEKVPVSVLWLSSVIFMSIQRAAAGL